MENSLKAVIYPINKEYVEILKYKEIVEKYEDIIPVCLSGQGIEHKDAGELVKGKPLGIEIMDDFKICMQDADDIIFTEFTDVSQIGSKKYSRIFGMHNFPKFMFQNIPETDKIYMFNSYVKQMEITEHPDIVILGVPGGVMPYDMDHPNGFGIVNYLVSNALTVDCTLLSLAYNEYEDSFWEFITDYMRHRYEYSVQSFHLSNVFHDIYGDERNEGERLVYMKQKKVDEKIASFDGKNVFNINNEETFRKEMDELIYYLTN